MSKQGLPVVGIPAEVCCAPLVCEPLNAAEAEELAPLFKAIAHPVRLRSPRQAIASSAAELVRIRALGRLTPAT